MSSKRNLASQVKKECIATVLKKFMDMKYDFICLGEVSIEDVSYISSYLNLKKTEYNYAIGAQKQGRLYFDTAVFYKKNHQLIKYNRDDCQFATMGLGSRNLKIFERYEFIHSEFGNLISLYLSHWPSRLQDNSLNTATISARLRFEVEKDLDNNKEIIMMGDYNVEPFSDEMVHHLQSSRDRDIVLKKPNIFYNPCWKFLPLGANARVKGTYNYTEGNFHTWCVIDQILISSSFLKNQWSFDDSLTSIIDLNTLFKQDEEFKNPSDHWPLSTLITRIN
ncbi:endonuclease [Acinetobacter baumannii]|nr:endonuclease [Acinetobacter baumannii]PHM81288.1 endonuclease [Acinetobacter baumannii]PHM89441.1 endonuclease [Acinetobacter baumannii]HAV4977408.1 endonuclease/exonuclease/phosphatase family protein [Acinetobacter baumannii]HAV4981272.1 endonuclease/exonuclease/phosphatase family protein [Acinetobacter baumannii]